MKKKRSGLTAMILVDVAAMAAFIRFMPAMRRPFEILMLIVAVLAAATALAAGQKRLRELLVVVASVAMAFFCLEMAEKKFGITNFFQPSHTPAAAVGEGSPYAWTTKQGSYIEARNRARQDGVEPEALKEHLAGDVFAGIDPKTLTTTVRRVGGRNISEIEATSVGPKPFYLTATDLEYEHNPDNRVRDYSRDETRNEYYFDAVYTIDRHGLRITRGREDAEEAILFLGDSFTFGAFLSDDETAAHYFSEKLGFEKNVVNAGTKGWGPHHNLRDLQLDRRIGPALAKSSRVGGVYFGLIDTHATRVAKLAPKYMTAPYYVLNADGRPEFRSRTEAGGSIGERLSMMMQKSRIYPVLHERLENRYSSGKGSYRWRLTVAVLAEIDRLAQERYGVPLTVVYWDENQEVIRMLTEAGVSVVHVDDVFEEGKEWRRMAIKYMTFDGHPSAYANKKLADHLIRLREIQAGD